MTSVPLFPALEDYVRHYAAAVPARPAAEHNGTVLTYSALWQAVERRAEELRAAGVRAGSLYPFLTEQNTDFLVTYLAVHAVGAAAVPLGHELPAAEYDAVSAVCRRAVLPHAVDDGENIADVLFTTGSTGQRKGVMTSMRALLADADNLICGQGFSADTVFVVCGPLNHIGSLSKVWPVLMTGGTLRILDGLKDMNALFSAFDGKRPVATFLVPAAIRLLLRAGGASLRRISGCTDFIETGGAAVSQSDMEAMCAAFPSSRLYNTYASTETGIVTTYDYNHNPCVSGCLGRALRHSSFAVLGDGRLTCSGDTVMSGYLDDTEGITAQVLRGGTVYTSDLAQVDSLGQLHLTGRAGDVINIGGYKVSPTEVEDAALAAGGVSDCICAPFCSPLFGDTIKLWYVADASVTKQQLARWLAARLEGYKVPRVFEQVDEIKHLFNGKPDRKYYNQQK